MTNIGLAIGLSDVQPLPSTIAGRAALCVTFNDHITEEKAYKCDWPNRVIVRPYRPPWKNIHETVSNGRYNHRGHQGNGYTMAMTRGCNAMQNNNKRYNNKHYNNKHYNNNSNSGSNNDNGSDSSGNNNNNTPYTSSVYEKLRATRAIVAPVNLIYGSHFSATEATYKELQNMGNFVEFTRTLTRITHKPVPV